MHACALVRASSNEDLKKEKNVSDGLLEVMSRNKLQAASLKLQAPRFLNHETFEND